MLNSGFCRVFLGHSLEIGCFRVDLKSHIMTFQSVHRNDVAFVCLLLPCVSPLLWLVGHVAGGLDGTTIESGIMLDESYRGGRKF